MDITTTQITNRFQAFSQVVEKFDLLDPHKLLSFSDEALKVACEDLIQLYPELDSALYLELLQLRISFQNEIKSKPAMSIQNLAELLFVTYNSAASCFPNVLSAMFIFLTLPVTTATAERSFSKLKLIKS